MTHPDLQQQVRSLLEQMDSVPLVNCRCGCCGSCIQRMQYIAHALREAYGKGLERVAEQCREGFVHAKTAGTPMGARDEGWEQLNIVEAWCRQQAGKEERG